MAANLLPIQPHSAVRTPASATGHQSPDSQRKNNWWTPLFGWSSEPDYINSGNTDKNRTNNSTLSARSSANSGSDPVKSRISPVKFTDEKARKLRMLTSETESFHDAMYHSAIASRFASDFSDRFDV
ncbi:hypothetical protein Hanom_Chr03g00183241 [Helianthus anomalus]